MENLIPIGNSAAQSADFDVSAGYPVTVGIIQAGDGPPTFGVIAYVEKKASNGTYMRVGSLTHDSPSQTVFAAGTYRVSRPIQTLQFGIDRE